MSHRMKSSRRCCNSSRAVELTGKNIGVTIGTTEFVLIHVYNEKYGGSHGGSINEIARSVRKAFPHMKNIVMGLVNSQKEGAELLRLGFWNGYVGMIAYRNGERTRLPFSYTGLTDYILNELKDPVKQFHNSKELESLDGTKHLIVGYFDKEDMPEYDNFRRVAHNLKENCQFYIRYGYSFNNETSTNMRPPNQPTIVFKPGNARPKDKRDSFKGCVSNYDDLNLWAHKKCMVREMTFDNYKELEDNRAFLILFYNPSNHTSVKDFCNIVGRTLMNMKFYINCVTIDGFKFAGILQQYGKNKKDLPFIVRSCGSMLPNFKDIYAPGELREFASYFCHRRYPSHRVSIEYFIKSRSKRKKSK